MIVNVNLFDDNSSEINVIKILQLTKIEDNLLNITKDFFRNYKNMHGKKVLVKNWFGKSRAEKIIRFGHIKYLNIREHETSQLAV